MPLRSRAQAIANRFNLFLFNIAPVTLKRSEDRHAPETNLVCFGGLGNSAANGNTLPKGSGSTGPLTQFGSGLRRNTRVAFEKTPRILAGISLSRLG